MAAASISIFWLRARRLLILFATCSLRLLLLSLWCGWSFYVISLIIYMSLLLKMMCLTQCGFLFGFFFAKYSVLSVTLSKEQICWNNGQLCGYTTTTPLHFFCDASILGHWPFGRDCPKELQLLAQQQWTICCQLPSSTAGFDLWWCLSTGSLFQLVIWLKTLTI